MTDTPEKPTDTPEQAAIKRLRQGFHVVSANAGTGKTHTIAQLIAGLYLELERQFFPEKVRRGARATGEEQLVILRQILAVTFTRDAAGELDDRIYLNLAEAGVEEPQDKWGRRPRISRTIDSYVQGWMRRPMVIKCLLKTDDDMIGCIDTKTRMLSADTRKYLAYHESGAKPDDVSKDPEACLRLGFFRAWPWLKGDRLNDILFDMLHRDGSSTIPGWEPEKWPQEFDEYIGTLPSPETLSREEKRAWAAGFWEDKHRVWKEYHDRMFETMDLLHRGELAGRDDFSELATELEIWESHMGAKKEFFSVLELARSRGYHPTRSFGRLASIPVLQELAASMHWSSFADWHDFAYRFQAEKLRYGVMDHADFLTLCIDTLTANKWLVEKTEEYPRFGIRAKYVLYDEVQDNSASNNDLFRLLCAAKDVPYLAVAVGDTKQGIYGFRGATAYGFSSMIEAVKKRTPQNVHYLSYSFRSHRKVVDLGNEVVATLPSYRDTVKDSQCVFDDPGNVIVAPPLLDEEAETEWVMPRVRKILETSTESVMVLHRNNLREHPLVPYVEAWKQDYQDRFSSMTIHRSKGLQAHHVFLLGMTATIMPDVRTSYDQMVNLLYVAVTRPRHALYITAPTTLQKTNRDGILETREMGPSPFLSDVITLHQIAEHSGWHPKQLATGKEATSAAAAAFLQRVSAKDAQLRREWWATWPKIPIKDAQGENYNGEAGSAPLGVPARAISRRSFYEGGVLLSQSTELVEGLRDDVRVRLRQAFLKNGEVPRLKKPEYRVALMEGWLIRVEGKGRRTIISPEIMKAA